ncbi:hypothetical protein GJ496_011241 [Pomphorhynchus laevis]|nr:hypothetical protein GJ496_011241 [Pomphorhynchus laevis]
MERMFIFLTISLLLNFVTSEPWKLKYHEDAVIPKKNNQDIVINKNTASTRNYLPASGQSENDYRWIVMPQQGQPSQNVPSRQQSAFIQDAQKRIPSNQMAKYAAEFQESSLPQQNIKANLDRVAYEEAPSNEQVVEVDQPRLLYEAAAGKSKDFAEEQIIQHSAPSPEAYRWDSNPTVAAESGSHAPSREYVLPPLYESSYAYQQPTIIQSPMPTPTSMIANPQQQVPQPHYVTQYVQQPMVQSSIETEPMSSSMMVPANTQPIFETPPQQQQQGHINDEYSRMDSSFGSDISSTYCDDYNPETKRQVLFKDPNSNIHFLTCVGKKQIRRMICPRYTVFNDYNKQCVERHQANYKCGPCENGGRCILNPVDNSYRCECTINFRGDHCEHFDDPCKRNPCGHGLCFNISQTPGYLCQCRDHVFNDNCNENIANNCHKLSTKRFYADRGNLFVHCSDDGLAFVKKCPPGMIFNDAKETCTFPPSYTRGDMLVHPPGSFRADTKVPGSQDNVISSRPKRNALWAW